MGCYYTLCHNTYSYSLLFYKVYMKRENAGSWNSGLEKDQILETYFARLLKSWNFTEVIFGINKKYWRKNPPEGAHTLATRVGGAPPCLVGPLAGLWCPSSAIWSLLPWKKIISKLSGRNSAATRRNLGGTNLGLRRSCSAGETSLPEGEIITIVIIIDPLTGRGQSPSTSSPAPSPLKP
mgnify:CR=1 FL=1